MNNYDYRRYDCSVTMKILNDYAKKAQYKYKYTHHKKMFNGYKLHM